MPSPKRRRLKKRLRLERIKSLNSVVEDVVEKFEKVVEEVLEIIPKPAEPKVKAKVKPVFKKKADKED